MIIKSNKTPLFNKKCFPNLNMSANSYREKKDISSINHFFKKLLRLKKMMLTEEGMKESYNRNQIMIMFLKSYFKENGEDDWLDYLKDYLEKKSYQ